MKYKKGKLQWNPLQSKKIFKNHRNTLKNPVSKKMDVDPFLSTNGIYTDMIVKDSFAQKQNF